MSGVDPGPWREGLAALGAHAVSAVLTVQCAMDWLRPDLAELRDEIDSAVITAALAREDLAIDRIVLHSLPVLHDCPPGEQAQLNAAHADSAERSRAGCLMAAHGRNVAA